METRLITPRDVTALAECHAASFGKAGWSAAELAASLAQNTVLGWCAFNPEGAVQGFILMQTVIGEAEILTFCTAPLARRQGIGRTLLAQAMEHARVSSVSRIFLEVAADNSAALSLYERVGFTRFGSRKGYYLGGTADAVTLELNL